MAAIERDLSAYDPENIGDPRDCEEVEAWIHRNMGDFSSIIDFRADFHLDDEHVVHDWSHVRKADSSSTIACTPTNPDNALTGS